MNEDWRVNNFDLLRLLAALQVAIVHGIDMLGLRGFDVTVFNAGLRLFPGVPIFFVISGFLISKSYERSGSVRNYYRNRCLRIYPALWACLVASLGVILIAGVGAIGIVGPAGWLTWWGAQMSLYQQYHPDFLEPLGIGVLNGSLWTIPIELEFYLALPVIYAAFSLRARGGNAALLWILAASLAVHFIYGHPALFPRIVLHDAMLATVLPYLWMFLVGVLIQRNWISLRSWLTGRTHWWLLGYLLIGLVSKRLHISIGSADISPVLLLPLAGLVISFAVSLPGLSDRMLHHNDISYGTYIYHMLVLNLMLQWHMRADAWAVASAVAISLCLGAISWWLIEQPFLRRKRQSLRAAMEAPSRGHYAF